MAACKGRATLHQCEDLLVAVILAWAQTYGEPAVTITPGPRLNLVLGPNGEQATIMAKQGHGFRPAGMMTAALHY
jgi:hypothetical protein